MQLLWIAKGEYSYPLHENFGGFALLGDLCVQLRHSPPSNPQALYQFLFQVLPHPGYKNL
jgi:hypothetical protein